MLMGKYQTTPLLQITSGHVDSLTRFAKISPLCQKIHVFGKFLTVYFLFRKMLSLLLQIWYIFGRIFIVADGQILKNNLTIWSHYM